MSLDMQLTFSMLLAFCFLINKYQVVVMGIFGGKYPSLYKGEWRRTVEQGAEHFMVK